MAGFVDGFEALKIPYGEAICYSGYREGQSPDTQTYPTYEQIREDLLIISQRWRYIRLYDCSQHAETVLDVIENESLDLKVLLGAYIGAELNNFNCPWGKVYTAEELNANRAKNAKEIKKLISLSNGHKETVFAVSIGNEASVDWTDHYVPVERLIAYAREVKTSTSQPLTFCENYVPWLNKLKPLVPELDFISVHTYPVWEYKGIEDAMDYTIENVQSVAQENPDIPILVTEAGWATNSNGRGIDPENVSEELQDIYFQKLVHWSKETRVPVFVFEAFDEPWKGSSELMEPEKHWGLFFVDRSPKKAMQRQYPNL
jgi:exo-beta-1,3-glucanase (GH17 family)